MQFDAEYPSNDDRRRRHFPSEADMRTNLSARGSLVFVSGFLTLLGAFTPARAASLTFEDRVEAQRALDAVRYSHQIGANRQFDEAVPSKSIRDRVQAYLDRSVALEQTWNKPITAEMLTREVDRMVRHSRLPDRLYEFFEALDHDPLLIRECLARPALVDRLMRSYFDKDRRIHAGERLQAEAIRDDLAAGRIDPLAEHPLRSVVTFVREGTPDASFQEPLHSVLPAVEFERVRARLTAAEPVSLEDETGTFVVRTLLSDEVGRLTIARYEIPKKSWDASRTTRGFPDP
jgi:hypothetical protein